MFAESALVAETVKLQKFAMRLTRNKSDADDLVQSTCLRALEKGDGFEDGTNLFGWTSKIMFNLFASSYRRRTKFETQYDPESDLEHQAVAPMQEINAELTHVRTAMMQLSPAHREIIILTCVKGMRYEEVSEKLQIPVGTVRSRLSRAREQLLELMDTPSPTAIQAWTQRKQSANANTPTIPAYIASQALRRSV